MSLEKLNLYRSKVKKIKFLNFILVVLVSLLPGVALRFYMERIWGYEFDIISLRYRDILEHAGLRIEGEKRDLKAITTKIKEYKLKSEMLVSRQKYLLDFFKSAYASKKFFKILYESWNKDLGDWTVLLSLDFDLKRFSLELYEIYNGDAKTSKTLVSNLRGFTTDLKSDLVYDITVLKNLRLRRMVIRGAVPRVE